jgi:transposase
MSQLSIASLFAFRREVVQKTEIAGDDQLRVVVRPDRRFRPRCGTCQSVGTRVWQRESRQIRDIPVGPFRLVKMTVEYQKVSCPRCGKIRVQDLDVCDVGGARVTRRFAWMIADLCRHLPVSTVAEWCGLDWKTVKKIHKTALEKEFGATDYQGLRLLAVDEIALKKGHRYLTVVIDFETGRVVWMGEGRSEKSLDPFFEAMPEGIREGIEAVAMDMWQGYINAVSKWLPHAAIVFDLFHIVQNYSKVIDQVRRDAYQEAEEEKRSFIKGSRWLLLRNRENLSERQEVRLRALLQANEDISTVYVLKDQLKQIFRQSTVPLMALALDQWCDLALVTGLKPLAKFVRMLQSHRQGILNYACHRIHTSKLEGINNKIKTLKRQHYGYHDERYFILCVKEALPGKSTLLEQAHAS